MMVVGAAAAGIAAPHLVRGQQSVGRVRVGVRVRARARVRVRARVRIRVRARVGVRSGSGSGSGRGFDRRTTPTRCSPARPRCGCGARGTTHSTPTRYPPSSVGGPHAAG